MSFTILEGATIQNSSTTLRDRIDKVLTENEAKVAAINGRSGKSVSYTELSIRSQRIANALAAKNLKFVGVSLAPSVELLTLQIGLVRQGVPFVAIDPALPQDRVDSIISDCKPDAVIFSSRQPYQCDTSGWLEIQQLLKMGHPAAEPYSVTNEDTFCILHTSGSSGRPKGVQIPHRALLNRIEWQCRIQPFEPDDAVCAKTQLGFVDSICETWAPFLTGTTIVYVPKTTLMSPPDFIELLNRYKITRLTIVPSLLRVLLSQLRADRVKLEHLKSLVSSGETLPYELCEQFFQQFTNCSLSNYYGSTEVMADVTAVTFRTLADVQASTVDGLISIGNPVDNTKLIIYQPDDTEIGEMIFTGANVTKGYHGQPINGEGRFVTAADLDITDDRIAPSALCFRTGDRARVVNGQLIYHGRNDSQVKIAGNRIDLSEVESALGRCTNFEQPPIVLAHNGHILAFVQSVDQAQIDQDKLSKALPSYAIPEFVPIETVPLLAVSGKVDRQALLRLYDNRTSTTTHDWDSVDNLQEDQKIKYRTLIEVLDELNIKVRFSLSELLSKNFFQIGGTSLNAILSIAIFKKKGYSITIEQLLTSQSLRDIIDHLESLTDQNGQHAETTDISKRGWTFRPFSDSFRAEASKLIADNFADEDLTSFISRGDPVLIQECIDDILSLMGDFWPYTVTEDPERHISFGMFDDQNRLIGAAGNLSEDNQPQGLPEGKHIPKIIIFLSECEELLIEKLKQEGKGNILHGFVMAVDKEIITDPAERVQGMLALERHLLEVAQARGFDAIISTNTSPMTQDAAEFILDYKIDKVVGQLNQWRPGPDEDVLFKGATDQKVVKVCYKLL